MCVCVMKEKEVMNLGEGYIGGVRGRRGDKSDVDAVVDY